MRNLKETFFRLLIMMEHFEKGNMFFDYSWYYNTVNETNDLNSSKCIEHNYNEVPPFIYRELPKLFID